MKLTWAITALSSMPLLIVLSAQDKSTQDGVYTDAQAKRGEAIYVKSCAGCHQPDLSGNGQTPPLAGKDFNIDWNDGPLSDLFDRTRISMPADKPGSLAPAEVVDVIAFLLSKGAFPAGQTELPADAAALKGIKFVAPKP
jgi:S-disulfanyl-L-cysteine oxidoreductase SoxD